MKKKKNYPVIQGLVIIVLFLAPMLGLGQGLWVDSPTDVTVGSVYSYHFYVSPEYAGRTATWAQSAFFDKTWQGESITGNGGVHADFRFNEIGAADLEVCVNNDGPCGSLTVYVHPMKPSIASMVPQVLCESGTVRITAIYPGTNIGSDGFRWYTSATGGSPIYTGATLQRSISTTTTYYVSTNLGGIESLDRTAVTAPVTTNTVNPPSVVTPAYGIVSGQATLQASGAQNGALYTWKYASGTVINTTAANSINVPVPAASITNFVSVQLNNGVCEGPRAWIPITVYAKPAIVKTGVAMGEPTKLVCDPDIYDSYTWYHNGSPVGSGNGYSTNVPGVYMVRVTKNGATGDSNTFTLGSQFQDEDENYIVTDAVQVKGITTTMAIGDLTRDKKSQAVQYFDGLGRPMQTVATQGSPAGRDIVQPTVYDVFGREKRKYLPVVPDRNDGRYKPGIIDNNGNYTGIAAVNVYNDADSKIEDSAQPYAETVFESSSLNRVLKQGAPGTAWQPTTEDYDAATDHSIKKAYAFNGPDEVILLNYNETTKQVELSGADYYGENQLQVDKTKDEQQHEVIEYIDKDGHTILKKVEMGIENGKKVFAETYYIYNDQGNLVVVLPPEAMQRVKTILTP